MPWKKTPAPKSIYRRQLSSRIKELREAAELTMAEVAEAVEINQGSLSRIESGDRGTSPVLMKAMLDTYGVTDPQVREDILDLVRADQAQRQKWWRKYSAVVNTTQYGGYLELETSATSLRSYEPQFVPGLLQTAEYARRVITVLRVDLDAGEVEKLVQVRMKRQELLERADAPSLWAVIDEAALCRASGDREIYAPQLQRLLDVEPRTNITLQLLPFEAGLHTGLYGSFMLMGFPAPNSDIVWSEYLTNSVYLDATSDVQRYTDVFDHLRAAALSPSATRGRIRSMLKEL